MKEIQLTQGKVALVDDEDFDLLNQNVWLFCNGYAARAVNRLPRRKLLYMHRVILNAPAGFDVDHISHDGLDNRKENLRVCTRSQNQCNKKIGSNNTSGFKGVTERKSAWESQIKINGKDTHIGSFRTAEEAARAYDKAARKHFGEFAYLNFPDV